MPGLYYTRLRAVCIKVHQYTLKKTLLSPDIQKNKTVHATISRFLRKVVCLKGYYALPHLRLPQRIVRKCYRVHTKVDNDMTVASGGHNDTFPQSLSRGIIFPQICCMNNDQPQRTCITRCDQLLFSFHSRH